MAFYDVILQIRQKCIQKGSLIPLKAVVIMKGKKKKPAFERKKNKL